jgi:perosamine synthetase
MIKKTDNGEPRLPLRGTSGQGKTENDQRSFIPYARQWIDEEDIRAVAEVLRSDWLTTGPKVVEFEKAFARFVGAREAVAVSSGTAALHSAMHAIGISQGDEVIVPPMTFAATANAVVFQGGTPVFTDVDADTLLLDPNEVEGKVTPRTKAIIAVDYAGQPCDYDALRSIAARHGLILISDACHALGAAYKGRKAGTLADFTVFSFHPVKHITTGEGGILTTDNPELADRVRIFRNHGITRDPDRFVHGSPCTEDHLTMPAWYYEMQDLGYNYRITDFQCSVGMSQLRRLPGWIARRQEIARNYSTAFAEIPSVNPVGVRANVSHAYHLYVIRLDTNQLRVTRAEVFTGLHAEGIGVNVHYIPVHLHPFYQRVFGTRPGICPVAEAAYEQIISLPLFPRMSDGEVIRVIGAVHKVTRSMGYESGCHHSIAHG